MSKALDFFLDNMDAMYYNPEYKYQPGHDNYNEEEKQDHEKRVITMK